MRVLFVGAAGQSTAGELFLPFGECQYFFEYETNLTSAVAYSGELCGSGSAFSTVFLEQPIISATRLASMRVFFVIKLIALVWRVVAAATCGLEALLL